jgi:hypothetical protein
MDVAAVEAPTDVDWAVCLIAIDSSRPGRKLTMKTKLAVALTLVSVLLCAAPASSPAAEVLNRR